MAPIPLAARESETLGRSSRSKTFVGRLQQGRLTVSGAVVRAYVCTGANSPVFDTRDSLDRLARTYRRRLLLVGRRAVHRSWTNSLQAIENQSISASMPASDVASSLATIAQEPLATWGLRSVFAGAAACCELRVVALSGTRVHWRPLAGVQHESVP
jgi:hypothetical protein